MMEDVPQWCHIIKDLVIDVLVGQVLRGLSLLNLSILAVWRCVLCRQGSLPLSFRQWWGQLMYLQQKSISHAGKNRQVDVLKWVY